MFLLLEIVEKKLREEQARLAADAAKREERLLELLEKEKEVSLDIYSLDYMYLIILFRNLCMNHCSCIG